MYDTIIIGAGMSGLAAGIRLAYYDQRVCILERHYSIGGLNSFYRLRGRYYDVGLHAITNYLPKGARKGPFARILRQLRLRWEDFALSPQLGSAIAFPNVRLQFGNDVQLLMSEIERNFPSEIDNFRQLIGRLVEYNDLDQATYDLSARKVLEETIQDPLLIEMLLCPLMWYGSSQENDMHFGQFCILFRSVLLEGLARPLAGIRLILRNLVRRFRQLGGELKLRCGVNRIHVDGSRATGVVLDDGQPLEARRILSSAGWTETMRMCDDSRSSDENSTDRLSFTESISVLDRKPQDLGYRDTIVFFNCSDKFHWRKPSQQLCDVRTGVICSPNNYLYDDSAGVDKYLPHGLIRITSLADYRSWTSLPESEYRLEKLRWYDRSVEAAVQFIPDFRNHVVDTDFFTPKTIRRYTWHDSGAVYGASQKRLDGRTHLQNVFICGTDQGFVGVVGAIISGISIANQYCLRD